MTIALGFASIAKARLLARLLGAPVSGLALGLGVRHGAGGG